MNTLLGYADISSLKAGEVLARLDEVAPQRRKKILAHKTEKGMTQSFGAGLLLEKMLKTQGIFRHDFTVSDSGKPYLADGVFFNISHSGGMVMCVLSEREIGCDVEQIREIRAGAMRGAFSPSERQYIGSSPERFYALWTVKESYIKFMGGTISSIRPDSIVTAADTGCITIPGADVRVISGTIDGYAYAVCQGAADNGSEIRIENFTDKITT